MVFSRQQSHAKHARYFSATNQLTVMCQTVASLQHSHQTMTEYLSIYITLCDEKVFIMLMFIHLSVPVSTSTFCLTYIRSLCSHELLPAATRQLAARSPPLWSVSVLKCVYQSIRTLFNVILISTVLLFSQQRFLIQIFN